MHTSASRALSFADVPGFLDSLEKKISDAIAFHWRELERGDLGIWIQGPHTAVEQLILREDLADEFRGHEGIRCAILDAIADGTMRNISGSEKSVAVYQIQRPEPKRGG